MKHALNIPLLSCVTTKTDRKQHFRDNENRFCSYGYFSYLITRTTMYFELVVHISVWSCTTTNINININNSESNKIFLRFLRLLLIMKRIIIDQPCSPYCPVVLYHYENQHKTSTFQKLLKSLLSCSQRTVTAPGEGT